MILLRQSRHRLTILGKQLSRVQQIDESEKAIAGFRGTATIDQRAFAVHVLFRSRND